MKYIKLLALFAFHLSNAHAALDPLVDAEDRRQVEAPAVQKAAASKDPVERARAALAYGRIHSPKSVDPLLHLLKDENAKVREAAAFNLGQLGWQAEFSGGREGEIQDALAAVLADKNIDVRRSAVEALGKIGLKETPALVASSLMATEPELRAAAVLALFRYRMVLKLREMDKDLADLPDNKFATLSKLAEDKDSQVRQNVAYYFMRVADARGETIAAKLTHDGGKWTRVYALTGLLKMKAKKSKADLVVALKDPQYNVRLAAVAALIASGENVSAYKFLAKDKSYHVRTAFASGLNGNKSEEDGKLLTQTLIWDKSPTVRAETAKAIVRSDPARLEEFINDAHWLVREAAVQGSEVLTPDKREKFLERALFDKDRAVKGTALEAMGTLPTATAFALVTKNLESPELILRGTAIAALKERKEPQIPELAWKTYANSLDRRWVEMRQDIVEILGKTSNDTTTGYLKKIVQGDPDPSVSGKARRALVNRGVSSLPESLEATLTMSPFRQLTFKKNPKVEFQTEKGSFTVECYPLSAPIHVADFIGNVRKGFYNGLTWHRVVPNFVVQGGDPDGTGWGDAGYALRAEISTLGYQKGTLGMPRSQGFDTGGSQLFFSHIPTLHLDGQYTVFGRITKGLDVLDRLERGDKIIKATTK